MAIGVKGMIRTTIGVLFCGLALASPAAAVTNLVTNGIFENGLAGWTETDGNANSTVLLIGASDPVSTNPSPDAAGSTAAIFQTDTGFNVLSQGVSLIAGHTYSVGFDYVGAGYQNPNRFAFSLTLDGQTLTTLGSSTVSNTQWATTDLLTTATSTGISNLAFVFNGYGNYAKDIAIDRVYLIDTTSAVPEPATWAMMIGGFGMVGAALRRKRRAARAIA